MDAHQLLLFVAAGLLLNLTPGPDVLYIVTNALRGGRRAGVVAACGITAGCFVHIFAAALGVSALLNWVGLDIKAPLHCHDAITGVPGSGARARESLHLLLASGVPFECRTTWHPDLFGNDQLLALAEELAQCGVQHWVVQQRRMPHQHVPPIAGSLHTALAKKFPHFGLR